jgi:alpha-galactosidase/6-phospho-beta-glucosidase family protein
MGGRAKIVMMGGGSYNWSPRIICDMMLEPVLKGSEVFLLDPDLAAAGEVKDACCKMNETLGSGFSFVVTSSEKEAFSGADFVVIAISTGGLGTMAHDLKIPEKYRIYQTVGDTSGPGGWNRTLRNVPVFAEAARKIEKLAPAAIILNYTNPMATLTGTFYEVSNLRTVGLCHGIFSTLKLLEKIFGVKEEDISLCYGGVNHFFWVTDFTVKGEPGYPLLAEKLKNRKINDFLSNGEKDLAGMLKHRSTLCNFFYRKYGMLTYIEDRHTSEFVSGYLNNDEDCLKSFDLVRTTVEERAAKCANVRRITAELASGKRKPFERSRETAVDIIKAFISNRPFVDVVNLPNIGQIDNLPRGAVVETMGLVDSRGFTPLAIGKLPESILPLVEVHCHVEQMTMRAALTGDSALALQALRLDPLCSHLSAEEVNAMGGELMDSTAEWLPQFYGRR